MIPFAVVMINEFRHGSPEMLLADRNQPIEAFFFDQSHEPFGVHVRIGRVLGSEDDTDSPRAIECRRLHRGIAVGARMRPRPVVGDGEENIGTSGR